MYTFPPQNTFHDTDIWQTILVFTIVTIVFVSFSIANSNELGHRTDPTSCRFPSWHLFSLLESPNFQKMGTGIHDGHCTTYARCYVSRIPAHSTSLYFTHSFSWHLIRLIDSIAILRFQHQPFHHTMELLPIHPAQDICHVVNQATPICSDNERPNQGLQSVFEAGQRALRVWPRSHAPNR